MAIQAGSTIRADDFINEAAIPTPQSDAVGKGVKLESNGKISNEFLDVSQQEAFTMLPKPEVATSGVLASVGISTNTTAFVGIIDVPYEISVNALVIRKPSNSTAGDFKVALFSTDGQTKIFEETVATGSGTGIIIHQASARLTITAGKYYVMIVPVGTTSFNSLFYTTQSAGTLGSDSLYADGGSLAPYEGTLTVSAGTIPSTFNPSSISPVANRTLALRLENVTEFVVSITTTGSWVCPAGVTSVDVECWGGGGSGAAANSGTGLSGGGGGGYSRKNGITVVPTTSYTATVGVGGSSVGYTSSGNLGIAGGDTWFLDNTTVLAKGGLGGLGTNGAGNVLGVLGGQAADGIGDVKYSGGASANANSGSASGGGAGAGDSANGGNASGGTGGTGGTLGGGNGGNSGAGGSVIGGGGGGGWNQNSGAGARGHIRIRYASPI